jgi:diguanylate cyclase (GGDEF)-like protein
MFFAPSMNTNSREEKEMTQGYDKRGNAKSALEEAFAMRLLGGKPRIPERIARLGVPEEELTEGVSLALSALLEKLDDTQHQLEQNQKKLQEIESLVDVDTLAPIPNRRAFMRRLHWVISMHDRYQHPSSIVYFDLNGFKAINDDYGHAAGDAAIRHVAEILISQKRDSDFMARLGGDEFAILMYYAEEKDARKRAKSIAEKIRSTPFHYNGKSLVVDTAIGVHAIAEGETAEDALHKADTLMYRNKRQQKMMETAISA